MCRKVIKIDYLVIKDELIYKDLNITYHVMKDALIANCELGKKGKIKMIRGNKKVSIDIVNNVLYPHDSNTYNIGIETRFLSTIKRKRFKRK